MHDPIARATTHSTPARRQEPSFGKVLPTLRLYADPTGPTSTGFMLTRPGGRAPSSRARSDRRSMCCTPAVNNKRHASVCATRLSGSWRWPARSKKGKTPSALAFCGPSVDSLYMVELKLDVHFKFHARALTGALRATRMSSLCPSEHAPLLPRPSCVWSHARDEGRDPPTRTPRVVAPLLHTLTNSAVRHKSARFTRRMSAPEWWWLHRGMIVHNTSDASHASRYGR